ncbi:unnamed protein product [Oreochromis niloticus]|nr:unnamed protein product [Mustela putorius furo]
MDSADLASAAAAPTSLEELLHRHEQMLVQLSGEVALLTQAFAQRIPLADNPLPVFPPQVTHAPVATTAATATPAASAVASVASAVSLDKLLPTPEAFSGETGKCAGFLLHCFMQFQLLPHVFVSDGVKIAYFTQLLRDRALAWAQAQLQACPGMSYDDFLSCFKSVFDKGSSAEAAGYHWTNLKQGRRSMADFSVDFWTLAAQTKWGPEALRTTLLNNIREELKDEIMMRELPASLNALMSLCIQVDDRLRARQSSRRQPFREPLVPRDAQPEAQEARASGTEEEQPMKLGRSRLSPALFPSLVAH